MIQFNNIQKEYFFEKIKKEIENQYEKFGQSSHSFLGWYSIVMEEIGEIAKEINEFDYSNNRTMKESIKKLRNEIIQAISCLIQLYNSTKNKRDVNKKSGD